MSRFQESRAAMAAPSLSSGTQVLTMPIILHSLSLSGLQMAPDGRGSPSHRTQPAWNCVWTRDRHKRVYYILRGSFQFVASQLQNYYFFPLSFCDPGTWPCKHFFFFFASGFNETCQSLVLRGRRQPGAGRRSPLFGSKRLFLVSTPAVRLASEWLAVLMLAFPADPRRTVSPEQLVYQQAGLICGQPQSVTYSKLLGPQEAACFREA